MHIAKPLAAAAAVLCLAGLGTGSRLHRRRVPHGGPRPGRSAQTVVLLQPRSPVIGMPWASDNAIQVTPEAASTRARPSSACSMAIRCGRCPAASGGSSRAGFRSSATRGATARWVPVGGLAPPSTARHGEHAAIHPPDGGQHGRASGGGQGGRRLPREGRPAAREPRPIQPGLAAQDRAEPSICVTAGWSASTSRPTGGKRFRARRTRGRSRRQLGMTARTEAGRRITSGSSPPGRA